LTGLNTVERNKENALDPYVGARPFTRDLDDQKRFFGRDDETDEIISLILSHRLVLIYAPSGAGKTSIFEAQVAPTLEQYGFHVLPRARVGIASDKKSESSTTNDGSSQLVNFYMLNVFQSLAPKVTPDLLYGKSLFEFLNIYFPFEHNGKSKPQVLVIDQSEELFTYYPGNTWREQQKNFFEQITKALEKNTELRIVFIIREDYLAQLDQFVDILPERLRPRFRLERLTKDAAFLAIKKPLEEIDSNSRNHDELDKRIKEIVKNLAKIRVEDPLSDNGTKEPTWLEGEFIEPIQLQVVCQRRWKQLLSLQDTENNPSTYLVDVDNALREFYEEEIRNAIKNTTVSEDTIRKIFQEKFITSSGTRAFVHERDFIQGLTTSRNIRAILRRPAFLKKGDRSVDKRR
jgi:hypothetical protein